MLIQQPRKVCLNKVNKCNPISDQAYDTSAKCETGDNFVWCGPPTCNYNPSTKTHQYLDVEQHLCVDVCPQSYNNQFHIKTDGQIDFIEPTSLSWTRLLVQPTVHRFRIPNGVVGGFDRAKNI